MAGAGARSAFFARWRGARAFAFTAFDLEAMIVLR
jgi:hypothetical protein